MKLVAGTDGALRADRTPTHDHQNHAEYIAVLRHIQRLREEAMNTHNKRAPSVKVGGAVRIKTVTTRRWSLDIMFVRRCRKRGNALLTPNEIETFPFLEKTRYTQRRPVCRCVRQRLDRSRCVIGATGRRRCDIQGGTNDTLPTPHFSRDPFELVVLPNNPTLMTNKRSESYLDLLEQTGLGESIERPTCSLQQRRRRLCRLRKCSVQGVSVSWRRAARLLLSLVPGCVVVCQISLDVFEIQHRPVFQKAGQVVDGACVSSSDMPNTAITVTN